MSTTVKITVDEIMEMIFRADDPAAYRFDPDIPFLTAETAGKFNAMPTPRTFGTVLDEMRERGLTVRQIAAIQQCLMLSVYEIVENDSALNPTGRKITIEDIPDKTSKPLGCSFGTYKASNGVVKAKPLPANLYPAIYEDVKLSLQAREYVSPHIFTVEQPEETTADIFQAFSARALVN